MECKKKDVNIAFGFAYGVFLMYVYYITKENPIRPDCDWGRPCIRFCCSNSSLCNDSLIRNSFNENKYSELSDFIILHGKPTCSLEAVKETEQWKIRYVSSHNKHWRILLIDVFSQEGFKYLLEIRLRTSQFIKIMMSTAFKSLSSTMTLSGNLCTARRIICYTRSSFILVSFT
jgi:hypothetical protein